MNQSTIYVIYVIPTPLAMNFIICFSVTFSTTINSSRNTSAFTFRFIMWETNETKLFKLYHISQFMCWV